MLRANRSWYFKFCADLFAFQVRPPRRLDAQVTVIDSLIPEYGGKLFNLDGLADRVKINIADVRDAHSMNYLVRGQAFIFNLAGQVSHLDSMHNPYTDLDINCRSQLSILEACRQFNPGVRLV